MAGTFDNSAVEQAVWSLMQGHGGVYDVLLAIRDIARKQEADARDVRRHRAEASHWGKLAEAMRGPLDPGAMLASPTPTARGRPGRGPGPRVPGGACRSRWGSSWGGSHAGKIPCSLRWS